jgi:hypothetical protein
MKLNWKCVRDLKPFKIRRRMLLDAIFKIF